MDPIPSLFPLFGILHLLGLEVGHYRCSINDVRCKAIAHSYSGWRLPILDVLSGCRVVPESRCACVGEFLFHLLAPLIMYILNFLYNKRAANYF